MQNYQQIPKMPSLQNQDRIVVQDYLRDSTIWDRIAPRVGDIVIASCYKSGTTLTQQIINLLVHGHDEFDSLHNLSPWVEHQHDLLDRKIEQINKLPNRRFLKSHLPLEALPYYPDWKYICLVRDGRDVAMSLFNHLHALTPEARLTSPVQFYNLSFDFVEFWEDWLKTGNPYWDCFEFIKDWWKFRDFQNVLLVHYRDLIHDKPAQVEKIADFLKINLDSSLKDMILHKSSLEYMKKNSAKFNHPDFDKHRFINQGSNGRWQTLLSKKQIKDYEDILEQKLGYACALWVKNGGKFPAMSTV